MEEIIMTVMIFLIFGLIGLAFYLIGIIDDIEC